MEATARHDVACMMPTHCSETDASAARRTGAPLIRLSWRHFVVIMAVCSALAAVVGIMFASDLHDRYARLAVKQFEREFGFESGIVLVSESGGIYPPWGITAVTPNGKFDRFGLRAGDIPFAYHGNNAALLYGILLDASRGMPAEIEVYNAQDAGNRALRRITIPASR